MSGRGGSCREEVNVYGRARAKRKRPEARENCVKQRIGGEAVFRSANEMKKQNYVAKINVNKFYVYKIREQFIRETNNVKIRIKKT